MNNEDGSVQNLRFETSPSDDYYKTIPEHLVVFIDKIDSGKYNSILKTKKGKVLSRENDISIKFVYQKGRKTDGSVPVVMVTHRAREADVKAALSKVAEIEVVSDTPVLIRIEDEDGQD